jgi:FKBP-type peptidyl-prolyl cis-trans isomerase FklB
MGNKKLIILTFLLIPSFVFAQKPAIQMNGEIDSVSYCMGVMIGKSLKMGGFKDFNEKLFMQAISEMLADKETLVKPEQADPIIRNYFMKLQSQKGSANIEIGKKFLDENKKKPGIISLPSGLQYKIIKDGQGVSPTTNDKVTVHYHGTLIDGKVFDSSVQRGKPIQLAVNGVIKGWTEALQIMKPGAKWQLFVPPDLGYGEQNVPGIEPNSVLIFEVELISVDKENEIKSNQ